MKHDKKITYSTGEFAAHFGIKKDTLFYYDKIKLFSPAGVKDNGYRYYTASQIEPFRTLLSLRELNVPIKVLQDYFQYPSPKKLEEISSRQLQQIQTEMKKLTQIQNHLTQISNSLQEARNAEFDSVQIKELPPAYLLYSKQMDDSLETSELQWSDVQDDFILSSDLSGITSINSVISESDLRQGNFDRISCLFAESPVPTEHLRKGGSYAIYYHKGPYSNVKFAYQNLFAQMKKLGYVPIGDAYEEYLIPETATKNEADYVTKIMLRVTQKETPDGVSKK